MIGRLLNERYRIIRKVGSGGMADVYEGVDILENSRTVAIKILKQEFSDDPQYLRRLSREAQAMVAIKNDHVVALYDMGSDGDVHYLVMEYVNGATLREYMDRVGKVEPRKAVDIVCGVLDGLAQAHRSGLIHRDVKPQNIMMPSGGGIKLTDFGIAKFAASTTKTYEGGEAMGSVYYISPEQAKGDPVDAQTDIYSVGIMLYEMLSGEPPFTGENAVQVALKHINEQMKPLRESDPRISPALSDVVARATAKDRNVRYASAEEMRSDLKRALRYPHSRFAKIRPNERSAQNEQGDTVNKRRFFTREQLPHIAIIGAVIGVIAVFAVMFLISMSNIGSRDNKVPNLLGYTYEAAATYARNRDFEIEIRGQEPSDEYRDGEICDQEPEAGSKEEPGTVIYVMISTGNLMREVPSLYGKTVEEAKKALEAVELGLDSHIDYVASSQPVGTVVGQSVNPGETLMIGDLVRISVCGETSSETHKMPGLVGLSIEDAVDELKSMGVTNYRIFIDGYDNPDKHYSIGEVISQNPSKDMEIIYDTVTIELTEYRPDQGEYKAEFSENVEITEDGSDVIITVVAPIGEIVLYHNRFDKGSYSIPFTGYYVEHGSFNCIIYLNGSVYASMIKNFE